MYCKSGNIRRQKILSLAVSTKIKTTKLFYLYEKFAQTFSLIMPVMEICCAEILIDKISFAEMFLVYSTTVMVHTFYINS